MNKNLKKVEIDWIGTIPFSWKCERIKNILCERNESNNPIKTQDILSLTNDRGVIPYSEKGAIGNNSKEDLTGYKLAYPNDIVLNSMNVIIGSVGLSKYFGCVSPVYYMLYLRHCEDSIEYFNYVFQTKELQNRLKGYGNGIMEIRMRIQMSKLNTVVLPYPPSDIQKKIVLEIKKREQNIDKLISIQNKQIESLKVFKKLLIYKTVTKGIVKECQIKPSGIQLIGDIPSNWELCRLKDVVTICNGKEVEGESGNIPVYGSGGVFKFTNKPLFIGESILLGRKGTIDKPMLVNGAFWTVDTMFYTSSIRNIKSKYLYYCCLSLIDFDFYKSGSVLPSMTQTELKNLWITKPSEKEQIQIIGYLDKECEDIDSLIEIKTHKIDLLQGYKNALIYEYVTGKREAK